MRDKEKFKKKGKKEVEDRKARVGRRRKGLEDREKRQREKNKETETSSANRIRLVPPRAPLHSDLLR